METALHIAADAAAMVSRFAPGRQGLHGATECRRRLGYVLKTIYPARKND